MMRSAWDASREYRPTRFAWLKTRPWTVAIVVAGEVVAHTGEFASKAEAMAYAASLRGEPLQQAAGFERSPTAIEQRGEG